MESVRASQGDLSASSVGCEAAAQPSVRRNPGLPLSLSLMPGLVQPVPMRNLCRVVSSVSLSPWSTAANAEVLRPESGL